MATCMQAQTVQDVLLPESRHIAGMVFDPEGKPVVEARIDHSGDSRKNHQTDSKGRFELDTRAPIFIVRKAGFRSELVRTQNATEVRVTLQKLSKGRAFPICSSTGRYEGIEGWGASLQFSRVSGVKASRQSRDIDYGARSYYTETKQGPKGIMHGSGPLWSWGVPLDGDVWRSVAYEESAFDAGGMMIIDARGKMANGNQWRYLGKFGESASYSEVDETTARVLDQFLDGACLKSSKQR